MPYKDPERQKAYKKVYRAANRERKKAYDKIYYGTNIEKRKTQTKRWYQTNREKCKIAMKSWHEANPEWIKLYHQANKEREIAYRKVRYEANQERLKAQSKSYAKAHPEKVRQRSRKRWALKHETQVEPINEKVVYLRDGWICQHCKKRVNKRLNWPDPLCASLDHIIPLGKGGTHTYKNVQLAHLGCNLSKNANVLPQGEQLRMF